MSAVLQDRSDQPRPESRRAGAPATVPELLTRFFAKVREDGECLIWTGALSSGYPKFWANAGTVRGHRWLWELMIGPVLDGWSLDHLCRQRACVRLAHLEAVPHSLNNARSPYHQQHWSATAYRRVTAEGEAALARLYGVAATTPDGLPDLPGPVTGSPPAGEVVVPPSSTSPVPILAPAPLVPAQTGEGRT